MTRDLLDSQVDLERRVRLLELLRADGRIEYAPLAEHPSPVAEWLCIPSDVDQDSYGVGRDAAALWESENEQTSPDFHWRVRLLREAAGVVSPVANLGGVYLNTSGDPTPIVRGAGIAGWSAHAPGPPRMVLAPMSSRYLQRLVIPGAPRTAKLDSGAASVGFSGSGWEYGPGGEVGQGIVLGGELYSVGSPVIVYALTPQLDGDDPIYVLTRGPNGAPIYSGFGRGGSYEMTPVTNPGGAVIGAVQTISTGRIQGTGGPTAGQVFPFIDRPGLGVQMAPAGTILQGGPVDPDGHHDIPIIDYLGAQVGVGYHEDGAGGPSTAYSTATDLITSWGPPVSLAEHPTAVGDLQAPSSDVLGAFADLQNPGDGAFEAFSGSPTAPVAWTLPTFAAVAAVADGLLAGSPLAGWAGQVLAAAAGAGVAYQHQWERMDMPGEAFYTVRFGRVQMRGTVVVPANGLIGALPVTPDLPTPTTFVLATLAGTAVPVYLVNSGQWLLGCDTPGVTVSLDELSYPVADA